MLKNLLILPLVAMLLAGCVSMSQEDCLNANWRAIGANDGVDGAAYSRLNERVSQCREFGIEANITAYNQGYDDGIQSYCTPRNGFAVGSRGASYNGVCPGELEPEFLAAYNEGRELHLLETNLSYAETALQRVYDQIDDRDDRIDELRRNQRKEDRRLPEDEYRERVDALRDEIRLLSRQLRDRRYEVDIARAALLAFSYRRW